MILRVLVVTALLMSLSTSPVQASSMPYDNCSWITSDAVRCTDRFGAQFTCRKIDYKFVTRWSCN